MSETAPIFAPDPREAEVKRPPHTTVWLIEDTTPSVDGSGSGFYSIRAAWKTASPFGWTMDMGEALWFSRHRDAEDFTRRYLPNHSVRIVGRAA